MHLAYLSLRFAASLALMLGLLAGCQSPPPRGAQLPVWDLPARTWTASDGKRMPLAYWTPAASTEISSVWIAVHGLGGGSEDFAHLEPFFAERHAIVIAPDLRGMGTEQDPRSRGDVASGTDWVSDVVELTTLAHQQWPDLPVFLHGESLGAIISIHAAAGLGEGSPLRGLVLSAPVVFFEGDLSKAQRLFFRTLRYLTPGKRLRLEDLGSPQEGGRLPPSRDPAVLRALEETPVRIESYTLRMLFEVVRLVERANQRRSGVQIPVLVLHAGQDVFIKTAVLEAFIEHWRQQNPRVDSQLLPDSHHLITRDLDAPQALQIWDAWWKRLPAR